MNIGITISLLEENESLWTNGIKLNAIYLQKTLTELGYNVYLLNVGGDVQSPYHGKVVWDEKMFPIYNYVEKEKETDLLIMLGATFPDTDILKFKANDKRKKVIKYICGNNYFNDALSSMFRPEASETGYNQELDEVWFVPQQDVLNREYYRILHNVPADKVRPVPFVWDPIFLDAISAKYTTLDTEPAEANIVLPIYIPGKSNKEKQLICFEPNMDISKFHMINLLIAEDYMRMGGEFKKLNIMCGKEIIKNNYYISVIKNTRIFNADPIKLNYLPRLVAVDAFAQLTDVVLAHQHQNPLNYSYLDALYLQFPLVHNASMLKDAGYYYEGNSIGSGARQLKQAMDNHDNNIEEYNERSQSVLTRYTAYNEEMLETYQMLIENTMGIKDHIIGTAYDWKTNLYK